MMLHSGRKNNYNVEPNQELLAIGKQYIYKYIECVGYIRH